MKRPQVTQRPSDDKAAVTETGQSRAEWFKTIEKEGASGRAAIGKALLAKKVDPWWITTLTVDYEAHAGLVEKDGRPKGYSICVTKSVAVPIPRAYQAFTTASDLNKWFGPGTVLSAREGGEFSNADGNRGTLKKMRPDKALVYTWDTPGFAEGSQVEVLFQAKGDKSGLVVNHTRVTARNEADEIRAGWDAALTQLKAYLEAE